MRTKWKIYNEDAVEWAKNYQKGKFHALLTDAPYHLTSITKRFGKNGSAPAKYGQDGVFQRASKGFMGTQWDGGDVAFRKETWEAFSEVLHPGAFGMAFSASRNWHRMAVAIEDAGFILHPTMFFLWVQGQGFPKATRVKGQKEFDGHRYGLQALKPAVEPIIVFQKPYEGKPLDNIVQTGAGALNIDGGRISLAQGDEYSINQFEDGMKPFGNGAGHKYKTLRRNAKGGDNGLSGTSTFKIRERKAEDFPEPSGRWPANLILDEESARRLDAQTGNLQSGKMTPNHTRHTDGSPNGIYGKFDEDAPLKETIGDSGGASRFFYQVSAQLDESDPFLYQGKVSPKERNAGLDDMKDVNSGIITNTSGRDIGRKLFCQICGHRQGACKCKEPEWGHKKQGTVKNPHPTLKPISLSQYLATLLLPPAEYAPRRIFVPFSGVASEMIGCGLAGWEHIVGVEFDTENGYVDIAEKRLEHWLK